MKRMIGPPPVSGYVTCPVYDKTFEIDNEACICPCCGDRHDIKAYEFVVNNKKDAVAVVKLVNSVFKIPPAIAQSVINLC